MPLDTTFNAGNWMDLCWKTIGRMNIAGVRFKKPQAFAFAETTGS